MQRRILQTCARVLLCMVFCCFGLLMGAQSMGAQELTAVVTQIEPTVTRRLPDDEKPRTVFSMDVVREGERILVTQDGRVGLACSSERWIELRGPVNWTLSSEACKLGRELPPGTYLSMVPQGGRFRTVGGILVLESNVRDSGLSYLLLSPRQTRVRQARPEIRWSLVEDAKEYVLTMSHLDSPVRVKGTDVRCQAEPAWGHREVCTHAWPEPGLAPGESVSLNLGYRTDLDGPLEQDEKTGVGRWVRRLDEATEKELVQRLAALTSLPWSEHSRTLAEAGLYAEYGLYADAIAAYQRALGQASMVAKITLADLYFKVGLVDAAQGYREVLASTKEPALRAAANFGMGRLYFTLADVPKARQYFDKSQKLYEQAGLFEEAALALKWAQGKPPILH